jgi:hypothetical protein
MRCAMWLSYGGERGCIAAAATVVIGNSPTSDPPQPSPRHNTTNMGAMEDALAAIESLGEGEFCDRNRIFVMIYPPHAAHSLQHLDVVMFKSLSSHYSKNLTNHTHLSLGILPIKKGDFVPLFWSAWVSSFIKELIFKAFEATGIWPRPKEQECCTQKVQTLTTHKFKPTQVFQISYGVRLE